jgi:hypothetical protein
MSSQKKLRRQIAGLLIPGFGIMLFTVLVIRAACVSLTCDEAVSFLKYAICSWEEIFTANNANNHLLNSVLMRLVADYIGTSEFLLRLPNLLGGALFILFSGMLVHRLNISSWLKVIIFLFINCNTLVFEFFALARGYGMASGLLMASIYHVYRLIETRRVFVYLPVAALSILLAALSSLMVVNFAVYSFVILTVLAVVFIRWKELNRMKKLLSALGISLVFLCGVFFLMFIVSWGEDLKIAGELYYGAHGEWDSLNSIVFGMVYGEDKIIPRLTDIFAVISVSIFAIAGICISLRVKYIRQSPETAFAFFIFAGLSASLAAHFVQYTFMDILYPLHRTGGYLVVLWTVAFSICVVAVSGKVQKAIIALFLCYAAIPVSSFLLAIDFSSANEWQNAEGMEQAMKSVIDDAEGRKEDDICNVSCPVELSPVVNYYIYRSGTKKLTFLDDGEGGFQMDRDYYIHDLADSAGYAGLKELYSGNALRVVTVGPRNTQWKLVVREDFETPGPGAAQGEGKTGMHSTMTTAAWTDTRPITDSLTDTLGAGTRYRITAWVKVHDYRSHGRLQMAVLRDNQIIAWRVFDFRRVIRSTEWTEIDFVFAPAIELLPGDKVQLYGRTDNHPLMIDDFRLSLAVREHSK